MPSDPSYPHKPFRSWNKGKFIGPKSSLTPDMSGQSEPDCSSTEKSAISPYSISPSIANYEAAISFPQSRRCRPKWLYRFAGNGAAAQDWPAGSLRDYRADPADGRCLSPCPAKIARQLPLSRTLGTGALIDDTSVRSPGFGVGRDIGLDPSNYGTHSLRRTKATLIYRKTGNLRAVQFLLGPSKIESTVRYLGVEVDNALAIAEQVDV
jgi:hypothetical protein